MNVKKRPQLNKLYKVYPTSVFMRKIFPALIAVIFVAACLGQAEVYKLKFAGMDINFRADLKKAQDIPLEPDPEAVRNLMFGNPVSDVKVAFVADDKNAGYYGVTGFELQYKTVIAYKQFIFTDKSIVQEESGKQCVYFEKVLVGGIGTQRKICFETVVLNNTAEADSLATENSPILLMEAEAEETKVSVDKNVVRIMGKDMSQNSRKYTDLDLAADKFLLVLLNESAKK